jgi:hypothetical protein
MQRAFRKVDSDGSGRIEMEELRYLVDVVLNIDCTDEDLVPFIFHCLDRGEKGAITYNEFVAAMAGPIHAKDRSDGSINSVLELQDHPLDAAFGKKITTQRPSLKKVSHARQSYEKLWDETVTRAAKAGDRVLNAGASSYQLGDRLACKAMNCYATSTQRQNAEISQSFKELLHSKVADGGGGGGSQPPSPADKTAGIVSKKESSFSLAHQHSNECYAPTIAAYAREVLFVCLSVCLSAFLSPRPPLPSNTKNTEVMTWLCLNFALLGGRFLRRLARNSSSDETTPRTY